MRKTDICREDDVLWETLVPIHLLLKVFTKCWPRISKDIIPQVELHSDFIITLLGLHSLIIKKVINGSTSNANSIITSRNIVSKES